MTPPLFLRDDDGQREIVSLDEELLTSRPYRTGRVTVFLRLGPGLQVKVSSRCQNKRRYTALSIRLASEPPAPPPEFPAYQDCLAVMAS
jgi:hypothetical protein